MKVNLRIQGDLMRNERANFWVQHRCNTPFSFVKENMPRIILKKFGLENTNHKRTHAPTHLKLSKDEKGVNVDQSLYRRMIGSLLYLKQASHIYLLLLEFVLDIEQHSK